MTIAGDVAATTLTGAWEIMVAVLPGGWSHREPGGLAAVTKVPIPYLNGVFADGVGVDDEAVGALLDQVADSGVPHCLQVRPGCKRSLAALATQRGMARDEDVPLMVLEDTNALGHGQADDLAIRVLTPEDAGRHASLAAAGFEAQEEHFHRLIPPAMLSLSGVRCYLGEVDGEPVTTGFGITLDDSVGIFNIATPPAHRRRGYGAAVTARAVRDGLASGARWAWLQASPAGYSIYERLGFRTIESWRCWLATGA
jgi:ribosomal protein S18 acetylase RimI-like enzyme